MLRVAVFIGLVTLLIGFVLLVKEYPKEMLGGAVFTVVSAVGGYVLWDAAGDLADWLQS